jgi:uncharacterized surface protein with fasciclin (FAS1) repeats
MYGLGLWCLMPLRAIFQIYRGVQFIGGGNRSTRRKPPTCRKSPEDVFMKRKSTCMNNGTFQQHHQKHDNGSSDNMASHEIVGEAWRNHPFQYIVHMLQE